MSDIWVGSDDLTSSDDEIEGTKTDLITEVESGDTLRSLIALRDYVAHELQGNRCKTCEMSKLRTGDTAALVLRLQKIIEDVAVLQPAKPNPEGVVTLADIRNRRSSPGGPTPETPGHTGLGSKAAPRRQGGRQPRF